MRQHALAVKAELWDGQGSLLLLRRRQGDTFDSLWDLPGGRVEWGEHPHEALRREVAEETGLTVEIGQFCSLWSDTDIDSGLHLVGLVFAAHVTGGRLRLSPEHTDSVRRGCDDLDDLPLSPGLAHHLLSHCTADPTSAGR